ncbi:MAG: hydroxyacid dehydrogenase [Promethearchaeota archaeon]|nr:MAG: hydroxyacid dehydrogenase [Candidatus Lokiarchaeota archaeon]
MKILISDELQEQAVQLLQNNGFEVKTHYEINSEELKNEIETYDAIIIRSRTKLTSEILTHAKKLKAIGRAGVGLDNVDLEKAEELGIKVLNTPEAPSVSVAELTIGLLLNLMRHISKADQTMHCGEWLKSNYLGSTLEGKKIGLIGYGNIGQAVAERCAALKMKIGIYDVDPIVKEKARKLGYTVHSSVDELIKNSQIVSLHIPATVQTENTINENRLKLMNKDTILINTARGNLVDEAALINALKMKNIGGAALDVYREEPLKNLEFCDCEENLILTPHIGSQTKETQIQASISIAQKISDYLIKKIKIKK